MLAERIKTYKTLKDLGEKSERMADIFKKLFYPLTFSRRFCYVVSTNFNKMGKNILENVLKFFDLCAEDRHSIMGRSSFYQDLSPEFDNFFIFFSHICLSQSADFPGLVKVGDFRSTVRIGAKPRVK
jgi:hypothetical protein